MLKGETEAIGKLFEKTMLQKHGPLTLNEHFLAFSTICDATQERQDAMFELVDETVDLILVIGGYNSSNTTHLQEIAIEYQVPSYHIDGPGRIGADHRIEHKQLHGDLTTTENWLPEGPVTVGVTSGASTPDSAVEEAIERIFQLKNSASLVAAE